MFVLIYYPVAVGKLHCFEEVRQVLIDLHLVFGQGKSVSDKSLFKYKLDKDDERVDTAY